jgi:phosphoglycolate phosphatase
MGLGEINRQQARAYAVMGLEKMVQKLFPQLSLYQQEQLVEIVQMNLPCKPGEVCLIPGIRDLLARLHDEAIHMAVATNMGLGSLQKALLSTGLQPYFPIVRTASQVPPKPCPQMLAEIMADYAIAADATLMIGDSCADMEMASQLGVAALGFDYYHQQESVLKAAGAQAVYDNYEDVARFILSKVS